MINIPYRALVIVEYIETLVDRVMMEKKVERKHLFLRMHPDQAAAVRQYQHMHGTIKELNRTATWGRSLDRGMVCGLYYLTDAAVPVNEIWIEQIAKSVFMGQLSALEVPMSRQRSDEVSDDQ